MSKFTGSYPFKYFNIANQKEGDLSSIREQSWWWQKVGNSFTTTSRGSVP